MTAGASLSTERAVTAQLTILVRCGDESGVLQAFHTRLVAIIERLNTPTEVLYVNAGAQGPVADLLDQIALGPRVSTLHLSPTVDAEAVLRAGLRCASGRAVIVMEGDLRDPPELIPLMVQEWRKGFEVVNMQRRSRPRETWLKRTGARLYDAVIDHLIDDFEVPSHVGDFRLIGPHALAAIRARDDRSGALTLLVSWLGYPSTEVNYERRAYPAGRSKGSSLAWLNRSIDGIFTCSLRPLRLYSYLSALSFAVGAVWLAGSATLGELTDQHLVVQSILLLSLGTALVGEYVGRLSRAANPRPNALNEHTAPGIKG
ncbi:glycosyltransferase [Pseudomonas kairouanensis]|uniref:Glycosyltransferase n=1 Tax=Pseudomonas kairouanensis TaxID=2293832 RepID=A0A4Z0AY21_9PSED|nr:glycosyltransferase [Pseudomonas kairouanensis]TFY91666.1 glycosyltransferase [Pseudomonas kairouanensis]